MLARCMNSKIRVAEGNRYRAVQARIIHNSRNTVLARVAAGSDAYAGDSANSAYLQGVDFYAILGVSPAAEQKELKRAYYNLIRELHPDKLGSASEPFAASAAELCVLLNEIYDVLSDEDKRATYDALAGFSGNSVNPFLDTSFARDQLFVDEVSCIGCGKCVRWAPCTFEIEASKYGRARVIAQNGDNLDDIQVAIEVCPVDCIHWVTLPQLNLLESALSTMSRVEVYIMQRYGRSAGNVFQEAFRAWEKRQAFIAASIGRDMAARQQAKPRIDWSFWGTGSLEREEREGEHQEQEQAAGAGGPAQKRIANLAAAAARSARMWRAYTQSKAALRSLGDGTAEGDEQS
mmetsp:Transcript_13920/g.30057  ORF Transcript_13920/g.30057 Transcript_13920/m.30057 type:complete len:348 (-) Transcript_13920:530-1573(-)